jgi:uroporphyrinogen-III synthase
MRLLVTRPEPDATTLKKRLVANGHTVTIEPLITIQHAGDQPGAEPLDLDGAQALIATSRNALRAIAASPAIEAAKALTLFAVGPGTAETAAAMGFATVIKGPADARRLVPVIGQFAEVNSGPLVHLAGDTLAYDFAADLQRIGFTVQAPVVYTTAVADRFASATVASLRNGRFDGVLLLSPRTASVYVDLVLKHNLTAGIQKVRHFCLSAAVQAKLVRLGAVPSRVAAAPDLAAILALIPAVEATESP